ncbi:MAG: hypothetical protein JWN74_2302 [Acidobacteriaceae bacterium]|nr:hypothetical protein [Acidobacteriaceae bacterium]
MCAGGQDDGVLWLLPALECIQMPSAILPFYTSEGFLIAADGRTRVNGEKRDDQTIKIFQLAEPGRSFAYAFGGTVGFTDKENEDLILFDLRDEILKIIKSLRMTNHKNFKSYAGKIVARLHEGLTKALTNERMERLKDEGTVEEPALVACLILVGYYEKEPSWIAIRFPHIKQTLLEPEPEIMPLQKGYRPPVVYGSQIIARRLFDTDDPTFAKYRVPRVNDAENVTLGEVAEAAKKYILACADPEVIKIDPVICAAIGGHIHMAKVTPKDGFAWLPEYRPVTASIISP